MEAALKDLGKTRSRMKAHLLRTRQDIDRRKNRAAILATTGGSPGWSSLSLFCVKNNVINHHCHHHDFTALILKKLYVPYKELDRSGTQRCTCSHARMHAHTHTCIRMHSCAHACMRTDTDRHISHRQTTQTDRQTETDRHTHHIDRDRHTHACARAFIC